MSAQVLSRFAILKPAPLDNENGVVGWWAFDDGQSTDYSGLGNNGVLSGAVLPRPSAVTPLIGQGLLFDGANSYVAVPHQTSLNVGDVFTFAIWCKRGSIGTTQDFFNKGVNAPVLEFHTDNTVRLGKDNVALIAPSTLAITDTTTFHHVASTKNGSAVKIYIDAVDVTGTITNATCANTSNELRIGRRIQVGTSYFNGVLKAPKVWNRDLSAQEISAEYNRGLAAYALSSDEWAMPALHPFSLRRPPDLSGLGAGGPFFKDPLAA